jgi:tetratricopeptide (TPR) repeat protein
MSDAHAALEAAQQARTLANVERYETDIIHAEWLLGAGLVMQSKDLIAAATHLSDALTRCRRINLVEVEPDILLAWARWHHARGNALEAQAHTEEALAIADRCEFRLKQAEIHNFLARLALEAGNREVAREHAKTARERARCDGPPYCYKPALDEAEGILRELGVTE